MMDRLGEWAKFSMQVAKHILKYVIPQYASDDAGMDQAGAFTAAQCVARGPKEALRDMLKIAHYACIAYFKLRAELRAPDVYAVSEPVNYGDGASGAAETASVVSG